jgi:non-specific serine/threonine protein kinase
MRSEKAVDPVEPTPARELTAVILPEAEIALEWAPAAAQVPAETTALYEQLFAEYRQDDGWLVRLAFHRAGLPMSLSLAFWQGLARRFAERVRRTEELEQRRAAVRPEITADDVTAVLAAAPLMAGAEYLNADLVSAVWARLQEAFALGLASTAGSVADYLRQFDPELHLPGRVYFHLVENRSGTAPFAFLATYSTRIDQAGKARHLPLKHALQEFAGDQKRLLQLLATVHAAGRRSPLVARLLDSGELFHPLAWSPAEAHTFLKEVPLYEEEGVLCRIPNWWRAKATAVRVRVRAGEQPPAGLGREALLAFDVDLALDGEPVSAAEVAALQGATEGLTLIKGKWVSVDPETLRRTLAEYERVRLLLEEGLSLRDALRLALEPSRLGDGTDAAPEITQGEWLQEVSARLRAPARLEAVAPGAGFVATLRPYQQHGLNWLWFLHTLGLGGCLADDMGLGKTVQVLAFLSRLRQEARPAPSLLVLPASLLGNWKREIGRFLPALRVYDAHPSLCAEGKVIALDVATMGQWDLVLTSYALVPRWAWLRELPWDYVILDEAQAIKNPGTAQTRAVKALPAWNRLVLTGTPVENQLVDLWSLFDFLNRGLLGSAQEFKRFSKGLTVDPAGYAPLRQVISPFLLRRLKTDKSIIADLPEKVEVTAYAELSRRQALLYDQMVTELREQLDSATGMQRRGLVLAALLKFKQICNHPDQYLGQQGYAEAESGKFARLREIAEVVLEKRERMLVFTQFRELTAGLHAFLETVFGRPGLVLHGGTPARQRTELVEQFQGRDYVPYMVLSLKAGGVGLNLTRANHVVHFDRWWNPAVESQATDRAFRIGQQKDVLVHRFVTRGTLEERIAAMLEEKRGLAERAMGGAGEGWITEMDNEQLLQLVSLGQYVVP